MTLPVDVDGRRRLFARRPELSFDDVPRHWFADSVLATHLANGINLLFPLGERFFIRSVKKYADRVQDPELREQVKGFMAQEVRHGAEHERFFAALEAHGFEIRPFLQWYERVAYDGLERRVPAALSLSVTVALEHFTAALAARALKRDDIFARRTHPAMRDLLLWHASEELEHKAVAFDVLRTVHPSHALRVAGLVVATLTLFGFWAAATSMLMRQEPPAVRRRALRDIWSKSHTKSAVAASTRSVGGRGGGEGRTLVRVVGPHIARAMLDYLRRDFHPSQRDDLHLAERYLERAFAVG